MHLRRMITTATITAALMICSAASAGETETWPFDVMTTGDDVFWTSPTSVDPDAPRYHGAYVIDLVEITVVWSGIPFGPLDVTDEIPKEDRQGEDEVDGPAPILLLDQTIAYPEPPEDPGIQAHVTIELDADGFGQLSLTEVILDTVTIDLGSPFGEQDVTITSVRVVGTIEVTPLGPLGDLNGDGSVGVPDLLILINSWGACDDCDDCPADLTGDCTVGVPDLLILINNWG